MTRMKSRTRRNIPADGVTCTRTLKAKLSLRAILSAGRSSRDPDALRETSAGAEGWLGRRRRSVVQRDPEKGRSALLRRPVVGLNRSDRLMRKVTSDPRRLSLRPSPLALRPPAEGCNGLQLHRLPALGCPLDVWFPWRGREGRGADRGVRYPSGEHRGVSLRSARSSTWRLVPVLDQELAEVFETIRCKDGRGHVA